MKNTEVLIGVCLVVLIGAIVAWGMYDRNESDGGPLSEDMTLYWGDGCPHCENVEKFLEEKQVVGKVDFIRKEVWKDRANAREMERRARNCGIPAKDIGVPFLFSDGQCFVGEPNVENEFLRKANVSERTADQMPTEDDENK
ncbi:MAG: hypothetical protein QG664_730 [Patescibacteria group bacterium]|nr:hypothetical protein [Patescibacteria group bacterium]